MKVAIVDYGMGNVASVRRALSEVGADSSIVERPESLSGVECLVLPGVGSFSDGMDRLCHAGWVDAIRRHVLVQSKPLLGICLGMQLLGAFGEEGSKGGRVEGLALIAGEVVHLDSMGCNLRIPHVGWDSICARRESALLSEIRNDTDFYFVHSYVLRPVNVDDIAAVCDYGTKFAAVVGRGRVWGTQFHPEKSSSAGLRILQNFLELGRC